MLPLSFQLFHYILFRYMLSKYPYIQKTAMQNIHGRLITNNIYASMHLSAILASEMTITYSSLHLFLQYISADILKTLERLNYIVHLQCLYAHYIITAYISASLYPIPSRYDCLLTAHDCQT